MAILKIARMGHPVLTSVAAAVPDPEAPDIRRLIADMLETMDDAGGVGLAGPQVHVGLRLFVYRIPAGRQEAGVDGAPEPQVLINPALSVLDPEVEEGWEGCLSIPGLRARVPRARSITFTGLDQHGQPVAGEASGFHARVMQHEYDHLNGVMYPMRMTDFSSFGFIEELARFRQEA